MSEEKKKTNFEIVFEERKRQVEEEGFTPEHDDQWTNNELIDASIAYLHASQYERERGWLLWPLGHDWFKPKNKRVDLMHACAMIIAELDRMDRAGE